MLPTAEVISANYDLTGKVALVSGATGGLGRETARVLALRNSKVLLGARSWEKGNEARKQILSGLGRDREKLIEVVILDLSSLDSVRKFVTNFEKREDKQLNILVNNAGIFDFSTRKTTVDGFEHHFGVNHLATFLLTLHLLPYLKKSAEKLGIPSRIVTVSSLAHSFVQEINFEDYNSERPNAMETYGISKLANLLFSRELNDRLSTALNSNLVISNSLHPGAIKTWEEEGPTDEALKDFPLKYVTIPEGAATQVFLAGDDQIKTGGLYYDECKVGELTEFGKSVELQKQLWQVSEKLVGLTFDNALSASV